MEVATWNGPNIHRSSWALGLRSEASSRFEKGLAPEQCMQAQAVAAQLMIELCGASVAPGTIDVGGVPPAPDPIHLRSERVRAILGVEVAPERQAEILRALDFEVADRAEDGLLVGGSGGAPQRRHPRDRPDRGGRPHRRGRAPAGDPPGAPRSGRAPEPRPARAPRRRGPAVRAGAAEIVGWSFADPGLLERLRLPADHELRRVVRLENPLSEDLSIMRPTLVGSLLDAARHNAHRNGPDLALFESGTVYRAREDGAGADEHHALGVLLSGALAPPSWRGQAPAADFFAAKALLESLLGHFHVPFEVQPASWPFLHPARSVAVTVDPRRRRTGARSGCWASCTRWWPASGASARTAVFAIDLGKLARAAAPVTTFRAFGSYPPVRQDIAVIVPGQVTLAELVELVREAAGENLEQVRLFDVYTGEQVGEGRRSLALALVVPLAPSGRSPTRTWRRCANGSSAPSRRSGASCVARTPAQPSADGAPRVLVAGATGFTGALAAHLVWRHPDFQLTGVTGRSNQGRRLDDLYPALPRPAGAGGTRPRRARGRGRGGDRRLPHAAAAPTVAALRERGVRVVDLSADYRLRSLRATNTGTASTRVRS